MDGALVGVLQGCLYVGGLSAVAVEVAEYDAVVDGGAHQDAFHDQQRQEINPVALPSDHGDRDIDAALNAGIGSIFYLDPSSPGAPTGRETFIIHDLLEIPQLVENWMY